MITSLIILRFFLTSSIGYARLYSGLAMTSANDRPEMRAGQGGKRATSAARSQDGAVRFVGSKPKPESVGQQEGQRKWH